MYKRTLHCFLTGCMVVLVVACGHGKGISPEGADHAEDHALAGADFQAGVDAYERGDYETALKKFLPLAARGNVAAQHNLGWMYDQGEGVPQDYTEAVKWYRRVADQGFADAQINLGVMYAEGLGVPQDDQEAMKWYRLAADQ